MGINDKLANDALSRQVYVQKYSNYEVQRMNSILTSTRLEIRRLLLDEEITVWTKKRYQALLKELTELQKAGNGLLQTRLTDDLKAFGRTQGKWNSNLLARNLGGFNINTPTVNQIWAAVNSEPMMLTDGSTMTVNSYIQQFNLRSVDIVKQGLQQGYLLGKPTEQIARELAGADGILSRRSAQTLVRTTLNHTNAMAHKATGLANSDIVKGYQWISTLDARTTTICIDRDTKVWYWQPELADKNAMMLPAEVYPPAHMNCRSTITYLTKSWKELGVDIQETTSVSNSTRASMDGSVPSKISYKEWLTKQPYDTQVAVLGKTRADLIVSGKMSVPDYYSNDGSLILLKDLNIG